MAGLEYRKDWDVLASYFAFKELASAPATPETNVIRFYAKDNGSGISTLCYKNDAGNEVCMPTSGTIVTGAGVVNRLAYWTSASVIDDVPRTFTAGSVLFAHSDFLPQEDNTNLFWDDTNNILAIGSPGSIHGATTTTRVSIERDATCILEINAHVATGTTFAGVDFYRSQGTHAAPSALGGNDFVGSLRGKCYDGNSYEDVARILLTTGTTAPADGATPGTILFQITPPASVTPTERFRMGQSGEFGIGGANFGTSGQVFTSGGTGAAPSWAAPATQTSTLLDGSVHTDTVAQTVSRGSLIYGNATPKWDELVIGTIGQYLGTDGVDVSWRAQSTLDHGSIGGLSDDDHTQYSLFAFKTIAVSGQSDVVADARDDILTLVAGSNITITTSAVGDSITIAGAAGGSGLTQPEVLARVSMRG